MTNFSKTEYENDGQTFRSGEVVRLFGSAEESWRDCIILGFGLPDGSPVGVEGFVKVKLARPYCYVQNAGTSAPGALIGTETFEMDARRLCRKNVERCNPSQREPGVFGAFLT